MSRRNLSMLLVIPVLVLALGLISVQSSESAEKVTQLIVATADIQGSYYPAGNAIAELMRRHDPSISLSVQATAGGIENARLLAGKNVDLALFASDGLHQAVMGIKPFTKKIEINQIMSIFKAPLKFVVLKNSGIKTLADLKGKRVAVNEKGSTIEVRCRIVLEACGLTYDDIKPLFVPTSQVGDMLINKQIDMGVGAGADPSAWVMDIGNKANIGLLNVPEDAILKIAKNDPTLFRQVIPVGTYKGIDKENITVGNTTVIGCAPSLPEDVVYRIVKTVLTYKDEFKSFHGALKAFDNNVAASKPFAAWHPGAIKYFKEAGIKYEEYRP